MECVRSAPLGVGAVFNHVAYYCDTIEEFLKTEINEILDRLFVSVDPEDRTREQDYAWKEEIGCLQNRLGEIGATGYIVFEYNIIRMAKRIDVVLLLRNVVYSLEFKCGQNNYYVEDEEQALDYAMRLKNFHQMSKDLYVCPVLIATKADKSFKNPYFSDYDPKALGLQKSNKKDLGKIIQYIDAKYGCDEEFDFNKWFWSNYYPCPSIVEAAVGAFNSVPVADLAHSEAGQEGIDLCVNTVDEVIKYAKENKKKCICFVTGVPGAGKTLVGIDIAAQHSKPSDDLYSVYISGNGPLVNVLQNALAESWFSAGKVKTKYAGLRQASALIQDGYEFRQAFLKNPAAPAENVLIFDEAQRCWNKDKVDDWSSKRNRGITPPHASEPELIVEFMNRHDDWAVIVCLVGLGQDIHDGESGIFEWFHSVLDNHRDWELYYSNGLFSNSAIEQSEKEAIERFPGSFVRDGLHLSVSVRSFRAEKLSKLVNCVLENDIVSVKTILPDLLKKYPIYVTRDLSLAKKWVEQKRIGSQRIGIIASSSSHEARSNGIFVPDQNGMRFFKWEEWFLSNDPKNQNSSNSLVYAASEFKIQGLEIDWAVVCWGADMRYQNNGFSKFVYQYGKWVTGNDFKPRNKRMTCDDKYRWIENAYRVNLTRARQGMVIYVPGGSNNHWDENYCEYYERTYEYLVSELGIPELCHGVLPNTSTKKKMMGPNEQGIGEKLNKLDVLKELKKISEDEYSERRKLILDLFLE